MIGLLTGSEGTTGAGHENWREADAEARSGQDHAEHLQYD